LVEHRSIVDHRHIDRTWETLGWLQYRTPPARIDERPTWRINRATVAAHLVAVVSPG
jgi:hypothetical protein